VGTGARALQCSWHSAFPGRVPRILLHHCATNAQPERLVHHTRVAHPVSDEHADTCGVAVPLAGPTLRLAGRVLRRYDDGILRATPAPLQYSKARFLGLR
jgi:hypothetical protein